MGLIKDAVQAAEDEKNGLGRQKQLQERLKHDLVSNLVACKDGHDFSFSVLEYNNGRWHGTAKWQNDGYEFRINLVHTFASYFDSETIIIKKPGSKKFVSVKVNTLEAIGEAIKELDAK